MPNPISATVVSQSSFVSKKRHLHGDCFGKVAAHEHQAHCARLAAQLRPTQLEQDSDGFAACGARGSRAAPH